MSEKTANTFDWLTAIEDTYRLLLQQVIDNAPQVASAVALLITGCIVAYILRMGTKKLINGINMVLNSVAGDDSAKQEHIKKSYTLVLSQIVFWVTLLFFVAASTNLLGWTLFSRWMDDAMGFLPRLVTGLFIILAGFLIGNAARSGINSAGPSAGIAQSNILGWIAQIVILVSSVIVGVELIGLNVHFITNIIVVIVGILLAGAALAFSLGAQEMVSNIIGAMHTRKHCRVGDYINIGEFEGEILEVTQTAIILDGIRGKSVVPAKLFHEQGILLSNEDGSVASVEEGGSISKEENNA